MSEAMPTPDPAVFHGHATVRPATARGMITLRADLSDPGRRTALAEIAGTEFPSERAITLSGAQGIAWMSPDELLVLTAPSEVTDSVARLRTALKGSHALIADVTDARTGFSVEGPGAREVLAKLSPADLSPAAFGPGEIRRTRVAQVAAAFWMVNRTDVELIGFRSTATYLFELLRNAARPGAEVGYF